MFWASCAVPTSLAGFHVSPPASLPTRLRSRSLSRTFANVYYPTTTPILNTAPILGTQPKRLPRHAPRVLVRHIEVWCQCIPGRGSCVENHGRRAGYGHTCASINIHAHVHGEH